MKRRCRILLMLMALMAIACSCGTTKHAQELTVEEVILADLQGLLLEQGTCENLLLAEAFDWQGTPYKYGGTSRQGVDCSGFVMQTFVNSLGIKLPRTSAEQAKHCKKVKKKDLAPGDLLFFKTNGHGVSHVGLYIGAGQFIHASSSKGVMVSDLDHKYWHKRLVKCGRVPSYTAMLKYEKKAAPRKEASIPPEDKQPQAGLETLSANAHIFAHRAGSDGVDAQAPAHLGSTAGEGIPVWRAEHTVSAVADRAFDVGLAGNDPYAHVGPALHRACQVVGHGSAIDVACQQDAAVARLRQLGVRKARWLPVGLDEIAVVESAAHAVDLPLANGVEWHVHGRRGYAVVVNSMAPGAGCQHQRSG